MTTRAHVWVSGRVQGVWFRHACAAEADTAGVSGWVSNLPDGRVEAVFEGDDPDVERLVDWCRRGPPSARVEGVEVVHETPAGAGDFLVR